MDKIINSECVILDVETTGLSPSYGDRIVEVAALKVKNLKPVARFHTLVNANREVSWGAFRVNGITREMLKDAPPTQEVLPAVLEFIGEAHLIGHNIRFDLSFLDHELSLLGLKRNNTQIIDTITLARGLMPHLPRYSLQVVADALGIRIAQEHRAMADVHLTFEVFTRLVTAAQKGEPRHIRRWVRRG